MSVNVSENNEVMKNLPDHLVELADGINTNRQFFDFIHSTEVGEILHDLHGEIMSSIDRSNFDDEISYLDAIENRFKSAIAEKFELKSKIGKRVRVMVKASFCKNTMNISFYPKWLPRNPAEFKKSVEKPQKSVKPAKQKKKSTKTKEAAVA